MPYAPAAVFQPGITQPGFEQLDRSITQMGDVFGQARKQAKAADALYKAVQPDPGDDGAQAPNPIMPKDKWDSLSWADKTAAMGGYMKKTALQSAMAEQQQQQARADLMRSQAAAEGGDARLLTALDQQVNSAPTDPVTEQPMTNNPQTAALAGSLTPIQRAVIHAGAAMGPNQKGSAAAIYRQLLPQIMGQGSEDNTPKTMEGPNGETIFFQPKTKNPLMFSPFTKSDAQTSVIQAKADATPDKTKLTDDQLLKSFDRQQTAIHTDLTMAPADKATALQKIDDARQEILDRNKPATKTTTATPATVKYNSAAATKILQSDFGLQ